MTPSPLRRLRARRLERGFTLVELLVATLAGLTVSLGAFALSRAATRSFQQETRLSDATSNATVGFRRLVADIERAGYLAPSNIQREFALGNSVCLKPDSFFPASISGLASFRIDQGPYDSFTGSTYPSSTHPAGTQTIVLNPDRITLMGSFASVEQFPIKSVDVTGGTPVVYLEPLSGAAMRAVGSSATPAQIWGNIFRPGRILRVIDPEGYQHFGVIAGADLNGTVPRLTLTQTVPLYRREAAAPTTANPVCKGFAVGTTGLANVINRMRYEVRDLRVIPAYNDLYPATPVLVEDKQRWELVRYELDDKDAVLPGTEELIAEFAIDLKFGLTAVTGGVGVGNTQPNPVASYFDFGHTDIKNVWGREITAGNTDPGPERVRSIRVRLSTRSREPDRSTGLDPTLVGAEPGSLFRYLIPNGPAGKPPVFARVRTLQTDVLLSNQNGAFL